VSWAVRPPPMSVPPPIRVLGPSNAHPRMMPDLGNRAVNGTYGRPRRRPQAVFTAARF
jgi:hypothetical protein